MHILLDDKIQASDAPATAKSAALSELTYTNPLTVIFDETSNITHFGIGNTDATEITLAITHIVSGSHVVTNKTITLPTKDKNGLYLISETALAVTQFTITHDGNYFGRIGAGIGRQIGTGRAKEPGYQSTNEARETLSGQVIPGAGGINFRSVGLDSRYKLNSDILSDIESAYANQIGKTYPFFILFDDEAARLPFLRLYAKDANQTKWAFDGSINQMLYSFKFNFIERF
jgi:hypothetical protein